MKKYQLTGQPIYVGEIYNHNGDLSRSLWAACTDKAPATIS